MPPRPSSPQNPQTGLRTAHGAPSGKVSRPATTTRSAPGSDPSRARRHRQRVSAYWAQKAPTPALSGHTGGEGCRHHQLGAAGTRRGQQHARVLRIFTRGVTPRPPAAGTPRRSPGSPSGSELPRLVHGPTTNTIPVTTRRRTRMRSPTPPTAPPPRAAARQPHPESRSPPNNRPDQHPHHQRPRRSLMGRSITKAVSGPGRPSSAGQGKEERLRRTTFERHPPDVPQHHPRHGGGWVVALRLTTPRRRLVGGPVGVRARELGSPRQPECRVVQGFPKLSMHAPMEGNRETVHDPTLPQVRGFWPRTAERPRHEAGAIAREVALLVVVVRA